MSLSCQPFDCANITHDSPESSFLQIKFVILSRDKPLSFHYNHKTEIFDKNMTLSLVGKLLISIFAFFHLVTPVTDRT